MDFSSIFKDASTVDKYVAAARTQTSFSAGAARIKAGQSFIPKWKMNSKEDGLMLVPLFIHMPFNIFTGEPYSAPVPIPGSCRAAIAMIKHSAMQSPASREALKQLLGDDYDKLNMTNVDVTDTEYEVFKRFRHQLIYAATVMSVKSADSKLAFGRPYRVPALGLNPETDMYEVIPGQATPRIYTLHRFETAAIAVLAKQLREENEALGDGKRPETEIADAIKNLWKTRCISNPYSLGISRVLYFTTDRNYSVTEKVAKDWDPSIPGITKYECYIKVNKKISEQFDGVLGSKYDIYEDYLLIKINVPEFDEKSIATAAQSISRSGAGSEDRITLKDFAETYSAYRNDFDKWTEQAIIRSAFEYKTIDDESITTIFKSSMPALSAAVKTEEIYRQFGDVISLVDDRASEELISSAMTGALPTAGDTSAEQAAAIKVDENTVGYGGDTLGVTEDLLDITQSELLAATKENS